MISSPRSLFTTYIHHYVTVGCYTFDECRCIITELIVRDMKHFKSPEEGWRNWNFSNQEMFLCWYRNKELQLLDRLHRFIVCNLCIIPPTPYRSSCHASLCRKRNGPLILFLAFHYCLPATGHVSWNPLDRLFIIKTLDRSRIDRHNWHSIITDISLSSRRKRDLPYTLSGPTLVYWLPSPVKHCVMGQLEHTREGRSFADLWDNTTKRSSLRGRGVHTPSRTLLESSGSFRFGERFIQSIIQAR